MDSTVVVDDSVKAIRIKRLTFKEGAIKEFKKKVECMIFMIF